jgi:hypothetical protein
MAQIGTFTRAEDGSYTGTIKTLSLNIKARFLPAELSENEKAPNLRVLAGNVEIGAAASRCSGPPMGWPPHSSPPSLAQRLGERATAAPRGWLNGPHNQFCRARPAEPPNADNGVSLQHIEKLFGAADVRN